MKKLFNNNRITNTFQIIVLFLFIIGCEKDDTCSNTTLNGNWNGKTNQNNDILFIVENKYVTYLSIDIKMPSYSYTFYGDVNNCKVINNKFTLGDANSTELYVSGKFESNCSAYGTFKLESTSGTWTATKEKEDEPPKIDYGSVTDVDGNVYKTVVIGTQTWMAENLKTTTYNNGTDISNVTENTEWTILNGNGAYCCYDNNDNFSDTYGALYNWHTVETGNLCPDGWHVPTDEEWTILTDYVKDNESNYRDGAFLRATNGWYDDQNGTDDYGFAALPGGSRNSWDGEFQALLEYGFWWSSTKKWNSIERDSSLAWSRYIRYDKVQVYRDGYPKERGYSVRCIRNE